MVIIQDTEVTKTAKKISYLSIYLENIDILGAALCQQLNDPKH